VTYDYAAENLAIVMHAKQTLHFVHSYDRGGSYLQGAQIKHAQEIAVNHHRPFFHGHK